MSTKIRWTPCSRDGDRGGRWGRRTLTLYLKNAYRVLLTRARQGMVIVVPPGDPEDPTRAPAFYDPIFEYMSEIGIPTLVDP
ncbi:DNA/RNA helicase domain-containing protein [Roseateles sp.]|uniref:DNA/RNA helicase domain-containing protein n=1 Tax=Roseateles sp. TaxID=1971397 RepID=UPI0032653E0B